MSRPAPLIDIRIVDTTGVGTGEDSNSLHAEYERQFEHYYLPVSRQWSRPDIKFNALKTEWKTNTAHLSSITEICMHPAYQQIIGMGPLALPYIFAAMREKPDHWFWALKAINSEDPILPEQRGKIKEMTKAWLRWAKEQGY